MATLAWAPAVSFLQPMPNDNPQPKQPQPQLQLPIQQPGENPKWAVIYSELLKERIIVAESVAALREARTELEKLGIDSSKTKLRLTAYIKDEIEYLSRLPDSDKLYINMIKRMFRGKVETDPAVIAKLSEPSPSFARNVDRAASKSLRSGEKKKSDLLCVVCDGFEVRLSRCRHCEANACDHMCGCRQTESSDIGQRETVVCVNCQFDYHYLIFKDCVRCGVRTMWRDLNVNDVCKLCLKKSSSLK